MFARSQCLTPVLRQEGFLPCSAIRNTSPRRRLRRNSLAWPPCEQRLILVVQAAPSPSLIPSPASSVGFRAGSIS